MQYKIKGKGHIPVCSQYIPVHTIPFSSYDPEVLYLVHPFSLNYVPESIHLTQVYSEYVHNVHGKSMYLVHTCGKKKRNKGRS